MLGEHGWLQVLSVACRVQECRGKSPFQTAKYSQLNVAAKPTSVNRRYCAQPRMVSGNVENTTSYRTYRTWEDIS